MKAQSRLWSILAVASLIAMTGCSVASPEAEPDPAPPVEVEPDAESVDERPTYRGTFVATDHDGYELEISYELSFGPDAYSDVSSEKPGFTTLKVPALTSLSMTNVTAGRDYQFTDAGLGMGLAFAFPSGSPACALTGLTNPEICVVAVKTTNDFSRGLTPKRTTLAPGETFEFETFNPAYGLLPDRLIADISIPGVPEDAFDSAGEAFLAPAHFVVFGWDALSTGCRIGLAGQDFYVLFADAPIAGC